jgi:hypothetical protein
MRFVPKELAIARRRFRAELTCCLFIFLELKLQEKEPHMKITTIALAAGMTLASTFALAQGAAGGDGGGGGTAGGAAAGGGANGANTTNPATNPTAGPMGGRESKSMNSGTTGMGGQARGTGVGPGSTANPPSEGKK